MAKIGDDRDTIPRQVGQPRPGQADNDQGAARRQELAHPRQRGSGIHMVQRRHAADQAKRRRRERMGKEVAAHKPDPATRTLTARRRDARGVLVDANHLGNPISELPGKHSFPAAHIQRPRTAGRDSRQD